ncbi:MAG TPA: aminotransferase class I/II-fold pyridoxal phosphate-dependent enzyme [Campylobacterales bacterium]|nr:aminotransferase class I/II-fold pyridoxal phosphate-dependent enzyme [Campylobacterales bacterium]
MKKHSHGGDIYKFSKELKTSPEKIIDFSSNINPCKPKIALDFNSLDISKYADFKYTKLKKKLSYKYGVKPTQIALFNGASSAIQAILTSVDTIVTIYAPAYSEYVKHAKKVKLINRFKNLYEEPEKDSFVIFVNPSTPDGRYYDLERLFEIWKRQNNTVLIDESFLDFTPNTSSFKNSNKLYILKSLTKFYSCAGVRVGIVLSSKQNIKTIEKTIPAWNISRYDENYIIEALKDKKFEKRTIENLAKDKKRLFKVLKSSKYIKKIYESDANFFLVKLKKIDASKLQKKCKKQKILIRNCDNFDFLDDRHVRFSVKGKKDVKRLAYVLS